MKIKPWIEAMRLRTLPVSVAGVAAGVAYALTYPHPQMLPAILCLCFALLAQIASNFANEYYDFKGGLDRPGRDGPRRGVTEGDISPRAMLIATYVTLGIACCVGLSLLWWGGWWLLLLGLFIAVGVTAYSTGPYPLSHHALGEVAVVVFYGLIPVTMTCLLMSGEISGYVVAGGFGIGLMGANVLIVNNYRDRHDDRKVGKRTLAVVLGTRPLLMIYLFNGILGSAMVLPLWVDRSPAAGSVATVIYLGLHFLLWLRLGSLKGPAINPVLGATAMLMSAYSLAMLAIVA